MIEPSTTIFSDVKQATRRRALALGVVLLAVAVMGWYAVTDSSHLAHDLVLTGGDYVGAALCHRITARSFVINGRQLPLCARCTGMYLGVAITFVALLLARRERRTDLPPLPILLVLVGFIGAMGIDGVNSYTHFFPNFPHVYEPRNWLRLVTGMGTGLAMGLLVFPALMQTLWRNGNGRSIIENGRELLAMLLLAGTAVLLVLSNQPTILYVMALVSVAGVLMIVTSLNAVLLLMLFKRDGRAVRWQETAVPLLISLTLAVLELGSIAILRLNFTGTITGFPGLA
ncbi:MAG: DUF2085 domain-containing protein [Ardenticatenaceae bacterium]|nr:DUF2085 domain-containing protein [Anaerolineales bacterium]MCB8939652.1 DUF2085 domain-containing protein [Ardenticatenaceae bacterium]MCB8974923.1 DUF2085 domain-containing protein [Ardenticatenaceae bacterium]